MTHSRILLLASLLFAPVPAAPAAAQQESWVALRCPSLCEAPPEGTRLARLETGSHLLLPGDEPELLERFEPAALSLPALLGLLADDASRRKAELRLLPSAPPLLVRGAPAAVAELRAALDEIERLGSALDVLVEAWWIESAAGVATHPEAGAARALAARGTLIGSASVRSGARADLGARFFDGYVAGYAVEVATDSGVAEPTLGRIVTGKTAHLRPCRVRGGRALHVEGFLDLARVAEVAQFDSGTPDFGLVGVPRVEVLQIAFSGVLPSDGWLSVAIEGSASWNGALLVHCVSTPDPAPLVTWRGADLALLEARVDELPMPEPGSGIAPPPERAPRVLREPLTSAMLAQIADEAARTVPGSPRPVAAWVPGYLIASAGDGPSWSEVDELLAAAERERLVEYEIALELGALRVRIPTTESVPLRLLLGSEQTRLVDYRVVVAQESWMPAPQTEHVFDGLLVQGHCAADAFACSAWSAATPRTTLLERKDLGIGRLELVDRALRSAHAQIRAGAPPRDVLSVGADMPALQVGVRAAK